MRPRTAAILALLFVPLQAIIAYIEGNLTTSQQLARGVTNGFPFVKHVAMIPDLLLVPVAIAIMWGYCSQWSRRAIAWASTIGVVVSVALHIAWVNGTMFQEHILGPNGLTVAGWVHLVCLAIFLAVIMLFYFGSTPAVTHKRMVAMLLGPYVAIGSMGVSWMKTGSFDAGSIITTVVLWLLLAISARK